MLKKKSRLDNLVIRRRWFCKKYEYKDVTYIYIPASWTLGTEISLIYMMIHWKTCSILTCTIYLKKQKKIPHCRNSFKNTIGKVFCVVFLCFLFVFVLCLVDPMLPVCLDCPFLTVLSVSSNVYLAIFQWHRSLKF